MSCPHSSWPYFSSAFKTVFFFLLDVVGVTVSYSKSRVLNLIQSPTKAHVVIAQLSLYAVQRTATVKVTVIRNNVVTGYVCVAYTNHITE
jgi:ABC-type uncharacterized transport system involved in gliding motility auxiliary subunit